MRMITCGTLNRRRAMVLGAVVIGSDLARIFMDVMNGVLDMLAACPARLAIEGQENEPPAVEAGQQRGEHAEPIGDRPVHGAAGESALDDRVLRMISGEADAEQADPGDRQS